MIECHQLALAFCNQTNNKNAKKKQKKKKKWATAFDRASPLNSFGFRVELE